MWRGEPDGSQHIGSATQNHDHKKSHRITLQPSARSLPASFTDSRGTLLVARWRLAGSFAFSPAARERVDGFVLCGGG